MKKGIRLTKGMGSGRKGPGRGPGRAFLKGIDLVNFWLTSCGCRSWNFQRGKRGKEKAKKEREKRLGGRTNETWERTPNGLHRGRSVGTMSDAAETRVSGREGKFLKKKRGKTFPRSRAMIHQEM